MGQVETASTLLGTMQTPSAVILWPRNSASCKKTSHLLHLTCHPPLWRCAKTCITCYLSSSALHERINKSSIYTIQNAHNQAQTIYSYAVRNDLGHYRVQMAWLAIKMSHSGSWMQPSLHQLLPWESNDTHHINQVWWSELPLASGWGAHQFVAGATNQQLSKHSAYSSWHTFRGQLLLFWQQKVLGYCIEKMMELCGHYQQGF